jgi:hypothetical protein
MTIIGKVVIDEFIWDRTSPAAKAALPKLKDFTFQLEKHRVQ